MNFGFLHLGTDGDRYKEVIIKYLPQKWQIYAFGPGISKKSLNIVGEQDNVTTIDMYANPIFQRRLTETEIAGIEQWLGFPFTLLLDFCIATLNPLKKTGLLSKREIIAKYVIATREFLTNNSIELVSVDLNCSLVDTVFVYTAKRLGLTFATPMSGRVENTVAIYDENYHPVELRENSRAPLDIANNPPRKVLPYFSEGVVVKEDFILIAFIKKFLRYTKKYNNLRNEEKLRFRDPLTLSYDVGIGYVRKILVRFILDKPNKGDRYFLFPLHWTLDSQILWREYGLDQFELIEKIAQCLPSGVLLYVRPHPHLMCEDLSIRKLLELKKLPNVKLTSPKLGIFETMKNSLGIITINSTAGFEAIMHDFPVITFGHDFYAIENVSIIVRDIQKLPYIFMNIITDKQYGVSSVKRKEFIQKYLSKMIKIDGRFVPSGLELSDNDGKYIAKMFVDAHQDKK
ncbi:Capsule polysaccharide biosynthesis protein [Candidatus Bilamarchaeum dharawalense]|uniref:Capsule polysaccharide biosynthesis protein n=1 Tax=Candidatus Bilamarchaeum dharawalense TaxID=2885759 RepID=A0A5E4LRC4_9ARCH|nr:Capsule polysaccharide biosynthesis protein [Candidatus Bilamarchaeum dharawalense]